MMSLERAVAFILVGMLLGLLLASTRVCADTYAVATVTSYHTNRNIDHNERNFGVGFETDIAENWRFVAGEYKNSYYRQSIYAGGLWLPLRVGELRAGAMFGGVTGYDNAVGTVIVPTIAWEGKTFGANLGIMPSLDSRIVGVFGLQLKVKF